MQPARLMVIISRESKIGVDAAADPRASTVQVVIVTTLHSAIAVSQLANVSKVIPRVVIIRRADLLALRVEALRYIVARVTLLARLRLPWRPDQLFRASDIPTLFFDNL